MNPTQEAGTSSKLNLQKKQTVLIIDDSPDMLELGKIVLELDGFKVLTAPGGHEALTLLTHSEIPSLILLDMQMADMSGPQFLKVLEQEQPEILESTPVVFLTGMNEDQIPESRASGFIRKATDIDKFVESVHNFLQPGTKAPATH